MSLNIWRQGVVFMRVDEVTFTPPSPPSPPLPLSLNLSIVFRPNLRTTSPPAGTSGSKCAGRAFDQRLMVVRYKCRTPRYLAYGTGESGSWTKPHKALIHPFIYSPSLPSHFQYQIFIPMVNKVMLKHRINHQRYDILICRIVKVSPSQYIQVFLKM